MISTMFMAGMLLAQAMGATSEPIGSGSASMPSGPFDKPLEPWLVTWILPVGGLISVAVAGWSDKQARERRRLPGVKN